VEPRAAVGVKPTVGGQARGFYYGDFADEVKSKDYDGVYNESGTSTNLRDLHTDKKEAPREKRKLFGV
jgi:hypothetical protein